MKIKKLIIYFICMILLCPSSVVFFKASSQQSATEFSLKNQVSYSHGSSVIVNEDELDTEIPTSYQVNTETQGDATQGIYTKLFDKENIKDFKLTISENNWNYMLQNAVDKPTVLATSVSIGDESIGYVGIKTKGNMTLRSVWQSDSDRFSFTVNFGKFVKKKLGYTATQNFYGLSKVVLNDMLGDSTLMKEYLSYELMREMGVDTPNYCLVNFYVNDNFYGIYMMVESIDSSLTERTIQEESSFLVKPESSGGDLIYNSNLDQYYNEETDSFDFSDLLHPDGQEELVYPSDKTNPLYNYCGLWENDEETFEDYEKKLPTVFLWLKKLNALAETTDKNTVEYSSSLESILSVDKLIRYFATNTYLVNLDSYQSFQMQNYGLNISKKGFASIFPWDYNFSFGAFGTTNAESMINFSITNPLLQVNISQRPLLRVILQNDTYFNKYKQYLNDCCIIASKGGITSTNQTYSENNFSTIIDYYYEKLSESYANDPTAFFTVTEYTNATSIFKQIINLRSQSVLQQLSGNTEKITTSLNISELGSQNNLGLNSNSALEERTLTDSTTGISISGKFSENATLSITKLSESNNSVIYQIIINGTSGGNFDRPDNGEMMPPSQNDQTQNGSPIGEQTPDLQLPQQPGNNGFPLPPDNQNESGLIPPENDTNNAYTIIIPNDKTIKKVTITSPNGIQQEIKGQKNSNGYTFTTNSLGIFTIEYSNNNSTLIYSLIGVGALVIITATIITIVIKKKNNKINK